MTIARLGLRAGRSLISNPLVKKIGQTALDAAKQSAANMCHFYMAQAVF